MSDLARIEHDVAALPERMDLTPDEACELLIRIESVKRRAKAAEDELKQHLLTWMPMAGVKELVIGDTVHFIGPDKKVKDKNVAATVRAIFEATGGDEQAFTDCLSVNAVKVSKAKQVLGDRFDDYFITTIGSKLEHKLQTINTKFIK